MDESIKEQAEVTCLSKRNFWSDTEKATVKKSQKTSKKDMQSREKEEKQTNRKKNTQWMLKLTDKNINPI